MNPKPEDKETRYFIDLDLNSGKILTWDYDQRVNLFHHEPKEAGVVRIYLTRGQYRKLEEYRSPPREGAYEVSQG